MCQFGTYAWPVFQGEQIARIAAIFFFQSPPKLEVSSFPMLQYLWHSEYVAGIMYEVEPLQQLLLVDYSRVAWRDTPLRTLHNLISMTTKR